MVPDSLKKFIALLSKMPQIGPRQATRLAFWLLRNNKLDEYIDSLTKLREKITICELCSFPFDLTQIHTDYALLRSELRTGTSQINADNNSLCPICRDDQRDSSILCVVEKETDLLSLEKAGAYRGKYFILGNLLSGMNIEADNHDGIKRLQEYIQKDRDSQKDIKEIILALSPTSEGDFTAMIVIDTLKKFSLKTTRLAKGLATGAELEFTDEETLRHAIEGRK